MRRTRRTTFSAASLAGRGLESGHPRHWQVYYRESARGRISGMRWRLVKGLLRLVVGLAVVATLASGYLFWRAMPAYSGSEKLPGLSAEARVWRDAYGVPHIFAASMDDAMRSLGYLHASERLFQMELQRRIGQGRMSEFAGADLLNVDRF